MNLELFKKIRPVTVLLQLTEKKSNYYKRYRGQSLRKTLAHSTSVMKWTRSRVSIKIVNRQFLVLQARR